MNPLSPTPRTPAAPSRPRRRGGLPLPPRAALLAPALAATLLAGCLENDEEIEVAPDGAVTVTLRSQGDLGDLAGGWPVPLGPQWSPLDAATERWLELMGPDTGSAQARTRLGEVRARLAPDPDEKAHLAVTARFASLADVPRFLAPESEPYRTALLERSAELEVRRAEGRTVYVLERIYHGRRPMPSPIEQGWERLPDELRQRFEDKVPVTPAEMQMTARLIAECYGQTAEELVRGAIENHYVHGDASLSVGRLEPLLGEVRRAVSGVFTTARLAEVYERELAGERGEEPQEDAGALFERLERESREALRRAFDQGLTAGGVPEKARNAARYALEWMITAVDHTADLDDEKFTVRVRMPGIVVDGNHDAREAADTVRWAFEGKDLAGRDRVLRVVSVLED